MVFKLHKMVLLMLLTMGHQKKKKEEDVKLGAGMLVVHEGNDEGKCVCHFPYTDTLPV